MSIQREGYPDKLEFHDSLYQNVASYDEAQSDTVVPNGETWRVRVFDGSGAYLDDTTVRIVWDPDGANEVIAATHGDATRVPLEFEVTGDGSKKLSIVLTNDTAAARVLGAQWEAEKVI